MRWPGRFRWRWRLRGTSWTTRSTRRRCWLWGGPCESSSLSSPMSVVLASAGLLVRQRPAPHAGPNPLVPLSQVRDLLRVGIALQGAVVVQAGVARDVGAAPGHGDRFGAVGGAPGVGGGGQ